MKTIYSKLLILTLLSVFLLTTSCGSVHILTRVKTIPLDYAVNFGCEPMMTPRTDLNREPWIVFSDREENQTNTRRNGGRTTAIDVDFLTPFLVIGSRGDQLRLVRYTPDVLNDNGRINRRNAEHYGWIERSRLLLNQQSVTNITDGRHVKMLTTFGNSVLFDEPEQFITEDSIRLFSDLAMRTQIGVIAPHSIVYPLKLSPNGSSMLIASTPFISPETVEDDILGWIDYSQLKNIGTGLHVNLNTVPPHARRLFVNDNEEVFLTDHILSANRRLFQQEAVLRYTPALSYSIRDSLVAFRAHVALPVFDYSRNFIFNVDGNQIARSAFEEITDDLQRINISFVFDGTAHTIEQFPQIVNALQNLQPLFEQSSNGFVFQFNTVMNFNANGTLSRPYSTDFTSDFTQVINLLSDKAADRENFQNPRTPLPPWAALHRAVANFDRYPTATNLIVLVGDRGAVNVGLDASFLNRIHRNNCRIIGFQVYAGDGDAYNDFVLGINQMITAYSDKMLESRRAVLTSPEQVRRENRFTFANENDNYTGFRLDFPDNSITQGALFFPPRGERLPMEVLVNNVDSIVQQIKQDNDAITGHLSRAFRMAGNNRTVFDSLFVRNHGLASETPARSLLNNFVEEVPTWYTPSAIIVLDSWQNSQIGYRLLLSELEMNELRDFIASLSEREVEFIEDRAASRRQNRRRQCPCCAAGDLFDELEREKLGLSTPTYTPIAIETEEAITAAPPSGNFANTRPIRRHLRRTFVNPINEQNSLCRQRFSPNPQRLTLAEAQRRITGAPTATPMLQTIRIRDLRNRRIVTDQMLERLVNHYQEMLEKLDKAEEFEMNGRRYFWVGSELLP